MDHSLAVSVAREALERGRRDTGMAFDEVALLFHSSAALDKFVRVASVHMDNFNSVPCDVMRRQDKYGDHFQVRFEFFRPWSYVTEDEQPWRIEAMCVLEGEAPLHAQAMRVSDDLPVVIHLSYKCHTLDAYSAEVRALRSGQPMRAEYQNSYGVFSYWGDGAPYLKPRVNLRDA